MVVTRWGICSAGKIAHDFLVALKTLPPEDHKVVAIASRDLSRAQQYAKIHSIPKAYGSYAELAEDADVDVVHIGVVNPYHLPTSLLFIQAGKNVLCEKPLGMNTAEVKALVQAARQKNVFFMEGLWTRFFPASEKIRFLLSQGSIGDVMVLHAEFGSPQLSIPRCVEKELGGGGLLDIGCYCILFACMVFNGEKPESILASGFLHNTGVDKTVSVILNYSGNRQAVLTCTMTARMSNRASIYGTKGMIEFPCFLPDSISLLVPNRVGGQWGERRVSAASPVPENALPEQHRPALRSGACPAVSPQRFERKSYPDTCGQRAGQFHPGGSSPTSGCVLPSGQSVTHTPFRPPSPQNPIFSFKK
nr:trans-1,2-dihydrobenzene-1,2-diol dehydrogenase-like isoform X2 [Zootoca vivipara]